MLAGILFADPQFSIPVRIVNPTPPPSFFLATVLPSLLSLAVGTVVGMLAKPLGEFATEWLENWRCKRKLFQEFSERYAQLVAVRDGLFLSKALQALTTKPFAFPEYRWYQTHKPDLLDRLDPDGMLQAFVDALTSNETRTATLRKALCRDDQRFDKFIWYLTDERDLTFQQRESIIDGLNEVILKLRPFDYRMPFNFRMFVRRVERRTERYERTWKSLERQYQKVVARNTTK